MNTTKIVYLADDDEDDRLFIKEAIRQIHKNIEIIEAVDGADLLDKITGMPAGMSVLVILDMNMPRRNGLEVLQALRADPKTRATPSIMLSTTTDKDLIRSAYMLGANAYIRKPTSLIDYEKVAQAIDKCFLEGGY